MFTLKFVTENLYAHHHLCDAFAVKPPVVKENVTKKMALWHCFIN